MNPLLTVDCINVFYKEVQVLREISMTVAAGEVVAVIGPNGAGKTTLLRTIVGLLHPVTGGITFRERRIDKMEPENIVRLGMAVVPEGARVFAEMTVLDNLKMGSYLPSARQHRADSLKRVYRLLPRLKERLDQKAGTLSGGERQMLAIGRALMSRPELLLLDEPSLGLAPMLVSKVYETVSDIASSGLAVLLVEQNVHLSLKLSNRAYVLENGSVALSGSAADLIDDDHVRRSYMAL